MSAMVDSAKGELLSGSGEGLVDFRLPTGEEALINGGAVQARIFPLNSGRLRELLGDEILQPLFPRGDHEGGLGIV